MKLSRDMKVGMFFFVGIIILVVLIERIGWDLFEDGYMLKAYFKSVSGLKRGDPVKLAGVDVGKVSDIGFVQDRVEVQMSLKEGIPIRADSLATIRTVGLLGANFMNVSLGSSEAPILTPGSVVKSEESMGISEFLAKADTLADKLGKSLEGVSDFFGENKDVLQSSLRRVDNLLAKVEKGQGTLGKLVEDARLYDDMRAAAASLNRVASRIDKGEGTLGRLVKDDSLYKEAKSSLSEIRKLADKINRGEGTLGKLVRDDSLYKDARATLKDIRNITAKINRGEGTVGKLVSDDTLYFRARDALTKVDKAASSIEEQGPLSVIGIALGVLLF